MPALVDLEKKCFTPDFRDAPATIRRSLRSRHQEVWIAEQEALPAGALFLRLYKQSLRIYSVAVNPSMQGGGLGGELMRWAETRAFILGKSCLILEAHAANDALIGWYERKGFKRQKRIHGYYNAVQDAWKMTKFLTEN